MNLMVISVLFGLVAFLALFLAWRAGAMRVLANFVYTEFLSTRERIEFARDMVYFAGGMTGLAPAIFGIETNRVLQAVLVAVTVLLVALVARALTRRLEQIQ